MKPYNYVSLIGDVGEIAYGKTSSGSQACTFMLAVETVKKDPLWIRVNAYDLLANVCSRKLNVGSCVFVAGELMTRKSKKDNSVITEVKSKEIIFMKED